jgi:hypothetical protein
MKTGPLLRWLASLHKIKKTLGLISPEIRRHSRMFSFAGASLVFATFVCKEVLLENQKSTVEQADNAQRSFLLLKRLDLITSRLTRVETIIEKDEPLKQAMQLANRGLSDAKAYFESFKGLVSEVKNPSIYSNLVERLSERVQDMESTFDSILREDSDEEKKATALEAVKDQANFQFDVRRFSEQLLGRLQNEKKQAEKEQKHITYWSYALYCAGFFFGLFGQLLGVKSAGSE